MAALTSIAPGDACAAGQRGEGELDEVPEEAADAEGRPVAELGFAAKRDIRVGDGRESLCKAEWRRKERGSQEYLFHSAP